MYTLAKQLPRLNQYQSGYHYMIDREKIIKIFKASPTPTSIIRADAPRFTFIQVNDAYTNMTQTQEEQLLGKSLFEAFPENPDEEKPTGVEKLRKSFEKVLASKQVDELPATRYDIVWDDGAFKEIYWEINNTPVLDENGEVEFIINSATNITDRILSERENNLMLNHTEDSFILIDQDLIIQNYNDLFAQNYKEIFGIEVRRGESILDYAQPERREIVKGIYERVFEGETVEGELPIEIQKGNTRHFSIKYKPAQDEKSNITGSFISLIERTEENNAKLELEKNEARFRALVENGSDVIFILNPDGKPTYISPSVENVLGYTQEEANEMEMISIVHPDDIEIIFSELQKCMDKPGIPIKVKPARMKHKDGSYRWFEGTITNMLHDPAIQGIVDNFREITDRKVAEEKIENAKTKYQSLIQTVDGIVWEADAKTFEFNYVSPQSKEISGYEPEQWIGKRDFWKNKIHPEDRDEAVNYCHHQTKKGLNHSFEYRMQKADGEYIWIRDIVTVLKEDGEASSLRGLMMDVTTKKFTETQLNQKTEQLQASLQEKETLLAEIHHRVKNNLAVVSGMMLLQAFDTENEALQSKLYDSVSRIKTMATVHELLYQSSSFSQLEFSETLRKLVENVSKTLQAKANVKLDISCDLVKLNINQAIPASLIVNEVITNAYKHAFKNRNSGKIELNLVEDKEKIDIIIKDNGVGFTEDAMQKKSLGLHLIQVLNDQISGTYNYIKDSKGTIFTLSFNKQDSKKGIGNADLN